MRVCVYGAGAMGTSFGVLLQKRSGIKINFITRNQSRVQLLNACGATVVGIAEGERVHALLPTEMDGEYDFIFLAAKQRENEKTAEFLSAHLKEDGALISLQNGLPEPLLAEILGEDRVWCGVLSWGAEIAANGSVNITSNAGFRLGLGAYGSGERFSDIEGLLAPAFEVTTGNFFELRFAKLATNASFSTLSVLSGLPFGVIAKRYRKYATRLIRETFNVARAYGCKKLPLNGHDLFKALTLFGGRLLPRAMKHYKETRSGMLKDLEAGRRCDIDFVAGAVVEAGRARGVEAPIMERAVALVHEIENGFAEIAPETIELLNEY